MPAEMLKYGRKTVTDWMKTISIQVWIKGRMSRDWTKATVAQSLQEKETRMSGNYRGISLLSMSGKIYVKSQLKSAKNYKG